ncbi:hypothetical protein [Nocardia sp. alder85J]|uniref:hypothetical protein n=1 Tax=Nocardia sp. alder85J TaxID=2862949 RepID=UPI001CD23ECD|nr:hypothetical protein [Nocardia sp. alder85J]MCX4092397.1 hypothetical protein [Nocardia sp. alder85J]
MRWGRSIAGVACLVLLAVSLYFTVTRGLGDTTSIRFAQLAVVVALSYVAVRAAQRRR